MQADEFSQFKIAFSASTKCLCVYMYTLPTGRHALSNNVVSMCKYVCQDWSFSTKYNRKYNIWGAWQFERRTLQICKSKPQLNHTFINNYHWSTDPKFCMQCIGIFQRWQSKVDLSIPECTVWYSQ